MDKQSILKIFYQIADVNQWHAHHTPKNLAVAISVEAAELLREFQWHDQPHQPDISDEHKQRVGREMADIYIYLLVLADKLGIDFTAAVAEKAALNQQRHGLG